MQTVVTLADNILTYMKIQSLSRRGSLVDLVVQQLRENIESQSIKPGVRLPTEAQLCEKFGVSRTVIREAARHLQSLGLIEMRRGCGLFSGTSDSVRDSVRLVRSALAVSLTDLEDFADFRSAIETHAARHAAIRSTGLDVERLQGLCDKLVEAVEERLPFEEVQALDVAFHLEIAAVAGNELIRQILELVREMMMHSMKQTTQILLLDSSGTRKRHQAIVDGIRSRDPEAAEKAMNEHMNEILERLTINTKSEKVHDAQSL